MEEWRIYKEKRGKSPPNQGTVGSKVQNQKTKHLKGMQLSIPNIYWTKRYPIGSHGKRNEQSYA